MINCPKKQILEKWDNSWKNPNLEKSKNFPQNGKFEKMEEFLEKGQMGKIQEFSRKGQMGKNGKFLLIKHVYKLPVYTLILNVVDHPSKLHCLQNSHLWSVNYQNLVVNLGTSVFGGSFTEVFFCLKFSLLKWVNKNPNISLIKNIIQTCEI